MGLAEAFDQTGRVVVITGGGTGIGRATALLFAGLGADVVLASRKVENLEHVAGEVGEATGRTALVVQTDVRVVEECEALIDTSIAELGRVDVLVNNAGGSHNHRFEATQHGKTLLVNPGEIWGHFTGLSSVAILDTSNRKVEKIELGRFKTFQEIIKG